MVMDELFKLFAKITEHYVEMCQESGLAPSKIVMRAVAETVLGYGYVLLNETYYEFLIQPQEAANDDAPGS